MTFQRLEGRKSHLEGGSPEPPKEKIGVKITAHQEMRPRLYHSVLDHYSIGVAILNHVSLSADTGYGKKNEGGDGDVD